MQVKERHVLHARKSIYLYLCNLTTPAYNNSHKTSARHFKIIRIK